MTKQTSGKYKIRHEPEKWVVVTPEGRDFYHALSLEKAREVKKKLEKLDE